MKRFIYIGLFAALTLTSCKDEFLERIPLNSVSEETFWKTENDVYLAVNGIYATLPGDGIIYEDGASDIAHAQYPWESTATSVSSGIVSTALNAGWNYETIRKTNYFLENVDKATMDETLKNRFKAEVRFMRAYRYFEMASKFGGVPLITKVLGFTEEELNVPRSSKDEVISFVLKELDEVAKILPTSYSGGKSNEKGRITKGAALALKSRILLNEAKYAEAAAAAQEVMGLGYQLFKTTQEAEIDQKDDYSKLVDFTNAEEQEKFRLALRSYEGIFHQANEGNSEVILERQYIQQAQPNYLNTYLLEGGVGGWSSLTPTQELVNSYQNFKTGEAVAAPSNQERAQRYANKDKTAFLQEYKNRDPRFYASILFETAPWNALTIDGGYKFSWVDGASNMSKTGYNFRKMVDTKANRDNLDNHANVILIRYAEVLLTYAEAKNEATGPDATVYAAIDQIRERAGMPKLDRAKYASKDALRNAIRQERKVELALEGMRYLDIRRWKTAPDVMKNIYNLKNSLAQERSWDNKLYLMPVPQGQMDLSYGVLVQNPGY